MQFDSDNTASSPWYAFCADWLHFWCGDVWDGECEGWKPLWCWNICRGWFKIPDRAWTGASIPPREIFCNHCSKTQRILLMCSYTALGTISLWLCLIPLLFGLLNNNIIVGDCWFLKSVCIFDFSEQLCVKLFDCFTVGSARMIARIIIVDYCRTSCIHV